MQKQDLQQFLTTLTVPLPSKGLVYPVGSPLHKKESAFIREMTAAEEDILTSLSLIRTGKAMDEVVKACIMDSDFDPSKLVVGDRNAILAALILASYGNKYKADVRCPECGELNKQYEFDINNLPVKYLSVEPVAEGSNEFEFILPKTKKKITFSLPTVEEEREISQAIKKIQSSTNKEMNVTIRLKKIIKSIDGVSDTRKIADWLDSFRLPIADSVAFREYLDKISPDIDTTQHITCNQCGQQSEVSMPIDFNFFWRTSR